MTAPALHTHWMISVNEKVFQFEIINCWYSGVGDKLKRVSYELKYKHTATIQEIAVEKLHRLIKDGKLKKLIIN